LPIVDSSNPNSPVSTKPGQLQDFRFPSNDSELGYR